MAIIVPKRNVWTGQPQNALELKSEYATLFTSLSVLSVDPKLGYDSAKKRLIPFTKSGSVIDSNPTAFGIGPKAGGTVSDYYSRTISVTAQAMWMIAVFVPTVVNTTQKLNYGLGSSAATAGAYIGISSGFNGTNSNVLCQFRGWDGGAIFNKLGPVPVVGKMMSAVFVCPSNLASAAYMYVDGSFYNTSAAGDGDTTFTTTLVNESIGALKRGAVAVPSTDTVLLVGYGLGQIPAALAQKLSENPWQIFAPRKTSVYFPFMGIRSPNINYERKVWNRQPESKPLALNSLSNGLSFVFTGSNLKRLSLPDTTTTITGAKQRLDADYISAGFGSTLGTGSTDKIITSKSDNCPTERTYFALYKVNSANNGGSLGRIFDKREGADAQVEALLLDQSTSLNIISFGGFWTTNGVWWSPVNTVTPNSWQSCCITYNRSSLTNVPTMRVNGVLQTVTTFTAPSGTAVNNTSRYAIGNRPSDNLRVFDGRIACVYMWDRILSAEEQIAISNNPWQIFAPNRQLLYNNPTLFYTRQLPNYSVNVLQNDSNKNYQLPATNLNVGNVVQNVELTYLQPNSDKIIGNWAASTGNTLYGVLRDSSAGDSDYIQSTSATSCEIKLETGSTPISKDNHSLKYRILSGSGNLEVSLRQGYPNLYVPEKNVWGRQPTSAISPIRNHPMALGLLEAYIPTNRNYVKVGTPNLVTDKFGIGFKATNSNYYSSTDSVSIMSAIGITNQCTIITGFVCSAASVIGGQAVYSERPSATPIIKLVVNDNTGANPRFVVRNNSSQIIQQVASTSVNDGNFHVVACTKFGSNLHKIYVDGMLSNTDSSTIVNINFPSTAVPTFANDQQAATTSFLSGQVYFVYTFSRALSDTEISSLSKNPWQLFAPRRQYFPLNQSTPIKTWNHILTDSTQVISQTLTSAEANTITNYSDLRVGLTSS